MLQLKATYQASLGIKRFGLNNDPTPPGPTVDPVANVRSLGLLVGLPVTVSGVVVVLVAALWVYMRLQRRTLLGAALPPGVAAKTTLLVGRPCVCCGCGCGCCVHTTVHNVKCWFCPSMVSSSTMSDGK